MEDKHVPNGFRSLAARSGLLVVLAGVSLPVLAASTIELKCDSKKAPAVSPVEAVAVEPALDSEPLTVLKTDAKGGEIDGGSDLRILNRDNEAAGRRQAELRSAALADALERRQRQRLALRPDQPVEAPQVETRLPGVSDSDSLLYRREMYRTDI